MSLSKEISELNIDSLNNMREEIENNLNNAKNNLERAILEVRAYENSVTVNENILEMILDEIISRNNVVVK